MSKDRKSWMFIQHQSIWNINIQVLAKEKVLKDYLQNIWKYKHNKTNPKKEFLKNWVLTEYIHIYENMSEMNWYFGILTWQMLQVNLGPVHSSRVQLGWKTLQQSEHGRTSPAVWHSKQYQSWSPLCSP